MSYDYILMIYIHHSSKMGILLFPVFLIIIIHQVPIYIFYPHDINFYISYNIILHIFYSHILSYFIQVLLFVSNQLCSRKSIILISISLILSVCRIFYQIEPTKLISSHRKYLIYDRIVKDILNCLIRITANL